jgi:uncharacterized protein involved in exopolysaccharide biosynthesis
VDFFDTLVLLCRRWYVVVPMLVLTLVATFFAYSSSASTYSATSSVLLAVPPAPTTSTSANGTVITPCSENPYCSSDQLQSLGNVVSLAMNDPVRSASVLQGHGSASYKVILSSDTRSPILDVSAVAHSPSEATGALKAVLGAVREELRKRQTDVGVKPSNFITAQAVVTTAPKVQSGGKIRSALVTLGIGLALTLMMAFLVDALLSSRRRRKTPHAADNESYGKAENDDHLIPGGLPVALRVANASGNGGPGLTEPSRPSEGQTGSTSQ